MHKARGHVRRRWPEYAIAAVTAGLVAMLVVAVNLVQHRVVAQSTPTPTPAWQRHYHVGETAELGAYALTLMSLRLDPTGSGPFVPGTDYEYYVVKLRLKNTGKAPLQVAPVVQSYLRDQSGVTYGMAPALLEQPYDAGALAPGEERTGELSYSVLKTATGVMFRFDPSPAPAPAAVFDLTP